ncbi:MAG: CMP-N-acetlyneuraminic acid synthetase [Planctomycetes bacterium]|jgi:N-acylneuraminate cytidylyltransferase/CMP-N,N'-diacetyllegionaminic acid synthase|nr:CMP-N-acetlyneuraminic acid synthetase [Planctomycetota bacterium]
MSVRSTVALIPARAGSKGLPGKNTLPLAGAPLIQWSIDQARLSGRVGRICVSTDGDDIAEIARAAGAEVIHRPPHLATDEARWIDTVLHGLDAIEADGDAISALIVLQPTSPLRLPSDVDGALDRLDHGARGVVSVTPTGFPLEFANTLPESGSLDGFLRAGAWNQRRQDLPTYYRLNGALYAARPDYLREQQGFHGPDTYAWVMPADRSIDIDDTDSFHLAEALLMTASALEAAR